MADNSNNNKRKRDDEDDQQNEAIQPPVISPTQPDIVDGPPYTQADPVVPKKAPITDNDILDQVDCTKAHLRKLSELLIDLKTSHESDEKSCAFRDVVVYDMWRTMGEFFRVALNVKSLDSLGVSIQPR